MDRPNSDSVGIRIPPPLVFLGTLLAGIALSKAFSRPSVSSKPVRWAGIPVALLGLLLGGSAVRTMLASNTSPDPENPPTTVVTTGPYRYTRNPIYMGMAVLSAGLALLFNSLWTLLLLPFSLVIVDRTAVAHEEEYLQRKFGEIYLRYKARVHRWL